MRMSKKIKRAVDRRLSAWTGLVAADQRGSNTKMVRTDGGKQVAYHRPGSQNRHKVGTGYVGKR